MRSIRSARAAVKTDDGDVLGHRTALGQVAYEVEVGLAGRGVADLDLLEAHGDQQVEHPALARRCPSARRGPGCRRAGRPAPTAGRARVGGTARSGRSAAPRPAAARGGSGGTASRSGAGGSTRGRPTGRHRRGCAGWGTSRCGRRSWDGTSFGRPGDDRRSPTPRCGVPVVSDPAAADEKEDLTQRHASYSNRNQTREQPEGRRWTTGDGLGRGVNCPVGQGGRGIGPTVRHT